MHERDSQNAIVSRAVKDAARSFPTTHRINQATTQNAPVTPTRNNVLRAGVQPLGEAVLGQ